MRIAGTPAIPFDTSIILYCHSTARAGVVKKGRSLSLALSVRLSRVQLRWHVSRRVAAQRAAHAEASPYLIFSNRLYLM